MALKTLGLTMPTDEIQDTENVYNTGGMIYYSDFCTIVAQQFRKEDATGKFEQELFRVLAGPRAYPDEVKADPYNPWLDCITRDQFDLIMTNLPEVVSEAEVGAMFDAVDVAGTGMITFGQFKKGRSGAEIDGSSSAKQLGKENFFVTASFSRPAWGLLPAICLEKLFPLSVAL